MNVETTGRPRVVILGGGFGGLKAARALKHAPVQVTLIDRNNHHVFQPLLYQVATAALESTEVAFPLRSLLRRQKNAKVLMADAESIDPKERSIRLADGNSLAYDYLIFAVGAQSSYFGHPEYHTYAPSLKNIRDALEIRYRVLTAFERAEQESDPAAVRALLTFVVVGGGPTGVELAGAIASLARKALKRDFRQIDPTQAKVVLIQRGPHVLPTYPADLQAKASEQLASLGVEVRVSAAVHTVDGLGVVVGSDRIEARTVLWGGGTAGAPIARSLGVPLDRHGRIPVTDRLHPPGLPNVFVIGDAAALVQNGQPVPGVAPAAIQGGKYAARSIENELKRDPAKPFHYWDKGELATIGRSRAVAMFPGGVKLSGFLAQIMYLGIHLVYLNAARTRVRVFLTWIWSYLTWSRGARLIPSAKFESYLDKATDETYLDKAAESGNSPAPAVQENQPAPQAH